LIQFAVSSRITLDPGLRRLSHRHHLLAHGHEYDDLGANVFDERGRKLVERRLVPRLKDLGYHVNLEPLVSATPVA
jgi:hypothetical protein